ncbi:MAG: cupredoxin domain-containing protein [Anaeromyxobacteraceae bacterium]
MSTEQSPQLQVPFKRFVVIGLLGMGLVIAIAVAAIFAAPAVFDRAKPGHAKLAADGVQELTVEVADGVYRPNVLLAKAGVPLRLHVVVRERHSCATQLIVPDLKLDFALPAQGATDLLIPAAPAGSYLFTCGMKMVKGSIVLE